MQKITLANTRCIHLACERLGIKHRFYDDNDNFVAVYLDKPYFFVNCSTPFNNDGIHKISKDKEFSYRLLRDHIAMPKTAGFFDPNPIDGDNKVYAKQADVREVAESILKRFSLPVVVKMNSGSQGKNVFLCGDERGVADALKRIYDKGYFLYDYVALAQDYIKIRREYRVVVFEREILLVYEKDISNARFSGNLSPLHYENAKAVYLDDAALTSKIADFIRPMFEVFDVQFVGLDIAIDENGKMFLLETNVHPGFSYFVRDNGEGKLVDMYEKILAKMDSGQWRQQGF
jgi:glutathione synthase/RimK-type ligase-like ATP-grasp enzyme